MRLLLEMETVYHGKLRLFNIHKTKENYKMHHMFVRNFILEFNFFYRHYGFYFNHVYNTNQT